MDINISTDIMATLVRAGIPMTVIDARTPKYDDHRRIPGAVSLTPDASEHDIRAALPDTAALVVTYCGGPKCPLSRQLGERLRGLGYENVLEYLDGLEGWTEAGHRVQRAEVHV
jgi:rhodanese-related sulfurtransferase